ncbi:MAG: glycoside hydrolase family 13 protein [Bifidobacterium sp.]|uniref:Glycoside hydrolase family 13 protein n=1 Tax=Bifidobacterium fermentum TaxID=3059035 RepID=A0AB39UFC7_9BIFI
MSSQSQSQSHGDDGELVSDDGALWWKQASVYQIYPRSFKDSTGSGLGDIRGITSKMDYLQHLGVDAIWLSPFYPSHLLDGGYDVDDYRNVDPRLGTMDDFSAMVDAAHTRGIKVVVDIVPNHTSMYHPWFQEALNSSKGSAARDRYIFRDGRGEHGELPPTNWTANFGGPAWKQVADGQWYLHLFTPGQPDLNWKNEEVRQDFLKTLRFWCDHGVDGFRVDVAHGLAKDLDRDDLDAWDVDVFKPIPSDGSDPVYDRNEVHEIYREWRKVFNQYDPPRFAVAEAWVNPDRQYLYASTKELGQVFNFEFAKKNWIRDEMHDAIDEGIAAADKAGSTSTWVMSNHDVPRSASRYALPQIPSPGHMHQISLDWLLRDGKSYVENRELGTRRAKAAILLELALPGSAYIYQGEELGLFEVPDIDWDELEDPTALRTNRADSSKGRDGCRVPLPWVADDASEDERGDGFARKGSFGFSPSDDPSGVPSGSASDEAQTHHPHLPQPMWFKDYAVDVEDGDATSMLSLYRKALSIRHDLKVFDTEFAWLPEDTASDIADGADGSKGGVIAYRRSNGWANLTNFGSQAAALPKGKVLLASGPLTDDGKLPQDTSVWMQLR